MRAIVFWMLSTTALGQAVSARAQEGADPINAVAPEHVARGHFERGRALAEAGDCRGALVEFEASRALVERPSTLYNIGQCQEAMFRYDLAVQAYERFLAIAPPSEGERAAVEAQLRSLRNLLGAVRVVLVGGGEATLPAGLSAEVWLGDRVVGTAPGEVLVPGGVHALEVRAAGYLPARQQVTVSARGSVEVRLVLEQAQRIEHIEQHIDQHVDQHIERPPLPPALFWTGAGLTLVAAGVGVGAGLHALSLRSGVLTEDPRLPRDGRPIADAALLADAMFITAGVLGTATIIVAFLTDWEGPPPVAGGVVVGPEGEATAWLAGGGSW